MPNTHPNLITLTYHQNSNKNTKTKPHKSAESREMGEIGKTRPGTQQHLAVLIRDDRFSALTLGPKSIRVQPHPSPSNHPRTMLFSHPSLYIYLNGAVQQK